MLVSCDPSGRAAEVIMVGKGQYFLNSCPYSDSRGDGHDFIYCLLATRSASLSLLTTGWMKAKFDDRSLNELLNKFSVNSLRSDGNK
ncbi:hypothetical protein AVEN_116211-1 [Araneus ventricosus]|uniref:Uncharacterized protein n=1 Tax=Araneus ventricosus TaxID=182803 RepID=A0A4Y2SSI9_ARAVE|nr:hypothetical protein AVEN_116211-1 [Araneus ventricosus]